VSQGQAQDARRVAVFVRERFGPRAEVDRLAGDASDRRFYRVKAPGLSSLVLMVHASPFELAALPLFLHGRFLLSIGASVPQIVASYPSQGILVVQDLGDETLQDHLGRCAPERRRFFYMQAVQTIALLQGEGTRSLSDDLPAARTALDRERLTYELRFFFEHYALGLLEARLTQAEAARLDSWLAALAAQVASQRRVLCHRDFHSRNLMVKGDRLFMVDYQDARLGPYTYDLVSLLRDSYVDLPQDLTREMVEFFLETAEVNEPLGLFMERYARAGLQRNIKAIGTFASQAVTKGNRSYLQYIPRTLELIRSGLGQEEGDAEILEFFNGPLDLPRRLHGTTTRSNGER